MGLKKALYKASATATPGASPAVPKGLMGKIIKALEASGALQSATSGSGASSNPKGLAGKVAKALGEEGKLKNVAEKTVASATGMKKGGLAKTSLRTGKIAGTMASRGFARENARRAEAGKPAPYGRSSFDLEEFRGLKKGGSVDKMGRAVKRKTADVKGRAMKGK